ncbi:hypothetical protein Plhal304r1_c014g0053281 [Plasmopara halstedii]
MDSFTTGLPRKSYHLFTLYLLTLQKGFAPAVIQFTGQSYSVVYRRNRAFNSDIPPFIKEIREKVKPTRQFKQGLKAGDTASIPPTFDDQSDKSDRPAMADDFGQGAT